MEKDIVSVVVDEDKEDVANYFKKYDLSSIAVVNQEMKMLGIITADDIIDVIDDEATEDKAIAAYNTVMDAGANAILGCVTSGACMAITDQTKADGI